MPIILRIWIVVDPDRRAKCQTAVCAPGEHHVGRAAPVRLHAGKHVNVIICTGTIYRDECLPTKPYSIYSALNKKATEIDQSVLVKARCLSSILCIRRAKAPELGVKVRAANKKITVGIYVQRSGIDRIGKTDWSLPRDPAVSGAVEFSGVTSEDTGPELV